MFKSVERIEKWERGRLPHCFDIPTFSANHTSISLPKLPSSSSPHIYISFYEQQRHIVDSFSVFLSLCLCYIITPALPCHSLICFFFFFFLYSGTLHLLNMVAFFYMWYCLDLMGCGCFVCF